MADPVLHAGIAHGQAVLTPLLALVCTQGPRYKKHRVTPSILHVHMLKPFPGHVQGTHVLYVWPANTQLYMPFLFPWPVPCSI